MSTGASGFGDPRLLFVFFVLFAAAEFIQIHVQIRRQTYSFTVAEVPLVLGLFYLVVIVFIALAAVPLLILTNAGQN